jgi:hypothetical protein
MIRILHLLGEILKNQIAILNALEILAPQAQAEVCRKRKYATLNALDLTELPSRATKATPAETNGEAAPTGSATAATG